MGEKKTLAIEKEEGGSGPSDLTQSCDYPDRRAREEEKEKWGFGILRGRRKRGREGKKRRRRRRFDSACLAAHLHCGRRDQRRRRGEEKEGGRRSTRPWSGSK